MRPSVLKVSMSRSEENVCVGLSYRPTPTGELQQETINVNNDSSAHDITQSNSLNSIVLCVL